MKKGILFLLLVATGIANAQSKPSSLKDLLYSGKLKVDSNGVVRKTDDLATKVDTSTKRTPEPATSPMPAVATATNVETKTTPVTDVTAGAEPATKDIVKEAPVAAAPKSTNKIWKEYTESMMGSLKTEVLPSKKIKKQSYFLTVDYEIGIDGKANIVNVTSDPENAFLQDQVKERMIANPPQFAPVLDSNNQPKKTKKKYSFEVVKE